MALNTDAIGAFVSAIYNISLLLPHMLRERIWPFLAEDAAKGSNCSLYVCMWPQTILGFCADPTTVN